MLPDTHKSRAIEGYEGYASGSSFVAEGLPLHTYLMPKYAGVDKSNGLPMWYKDVLDADGNILGRTMTSEYSEATEYLCGNPTPDLYGGFGTSVSYKNFDVSASFTYQIGGLSSNSGYAQYMTPPGGTTGSNFHVDVLKSWTPENPDSDIPRFVYNDQNITAGSDRFLHDASYVNFQNAQIGYSFPRHLMEKIKIEKLRVYVSCDNIVYWSRMHGFDPRGSFSGGTSYANNSPVRTISAGVNFTF